MSTAAMTFEKSALAQARLHELIPGGAHTYARGSDQFPEDMTPILVRGRGARVRGSGRQLAGRVRDGLAVHHAWSWLRAGGGCGLQRGRRRRQLFAAEHVGAACRRGLLGSRFPGADMVKFAKNGSDVTTAAIKLARAATGRDLVAICGTQPFFSVDDWFIASTQMKAGIPSAYGSMTVKFNYNDLPSVEALFDAYPDQIAAVILEPATATRRARTWFPRGSAIS